MVLTSLSAHHKSWVVGWRGNHAEHLARGRFDSHNTSYLAFEKSFSKCLKLYVYTQRKILSGYRSAIILAILIFALDSSMGITQKNLNALLASELLFVITLNTKFSDEITCLIVVVILYVRF